MSIQRKSIIHMAFSFLSLVPVSLNNYIFFKMCQFFLPGVTNWNTGGQSRLRRDIWTEWSVMWSEIIRVVLKLDEREARARFEITSMISDQI